MNHKLARMFEIAEEAMMKSSDAVMRSAEVGLNDAYGLIGTSREKYAVNRLKESIQYSVGVFSPLYVEFEKLMKE